MPLDTVTLILLGLYLSIIIAAPFLLAQRTRWTTRWEPPVKRVFAWYVLSFEGVASAYLLLYVQATFFASNRVISISMLGTASVLGMTGLLGVFRIRKRLEAPRLQYPAQR